VNSVGILWIERLLAQLAHRFELRAERKLDHLAGWSRGIESVNSFAFHLRVLCQNRLR